MSRNKKGTPTVSEASVQDLLPSALARAGLALPTTPEQVEQEERELEREPIATPHRLRAQIAVLDEISDYYGHTTRDIAQAKIAALRKELEK